MKSILILTTLMTSSAWAVALPSRSECKAREANAIEAVTAVEDRFKVGEVTRTDVAMTKLSLVDVQLVCANIIRGSAHEAGTYCSQANADLLNTYVQGVIAEVNVGMRDQADLLRAKDYEIVVKNICQ